MPLRRRIALLPTILRRACSAITEGAMAGNSGRDGAALGLRRNADRDAAKPQARVAQLAFQCRAAIVDHPGRVALVGDKGDLQAVANALQAQGEAAEVMGRQYHFEIAARRESPGVEAAFDAAAAGGAVRAAPTCDGARGALALRSEKSRSARRRRFGLGRRGRLDLTRRCLGRGRAVTRGSAAAPMSRRRPSERIRRGPARARSPGW